MNFGFFIKCTSVRSNRTVLVPVDNIAYVIDAECDKKPCVSIVLKKGAASVEVIGSTETIEELLESERTKMVSDIGFAKSLMEEKLDAALTDKSY